MVEDFQGFEPDQESIAKAEALTGKLMSNVLERRPSVSGVDEEIPLNDVSMNLDRLGLLLTASDRFGLPLLSLGTESNTPVAIDLVPRQARTFTRLYEQFIEYGYPVFYRYLFLRYPSLRRRQHVENRMGELYFADSETVSSSTSSLLSSFLASRIAGISRILRGSSRGSASEQIYLAVTVNTTNSRLQIWSAPSYFDTWTYFGAPTTPVDGHLLPGRYKFGGVGPPVPRFKRDPAVVMIPPSLNITLVAF